MGVDVSIMFQGGAVGGGGAAGRASAPYDMGTGNDQYNDPPFSSGPVRGELK